MTQPISINKTALLVMDFQNVILTKYLSTEEASKVLTNTAELLAAARKACMKVVHVMVGFRAGHPEISPRNALFSSVKGHGLFLLNDPNTQIHAEVAPASDEPVVIKHRLGAFSGTDLATLLRANGIETLLLTGVTTTGVLLTTVRQAFDLDFRLIVASDCCADPDADAHMALLEKVLPQHAEVLTSAAAKQLLK